MTQSTLQQKIQAAKEAGSLSDQATAETGFKRTITPAGVSTARFVGYVEIGDQPQDPWQGKPKDDAPMVRLTWELNGPAYLRNVAKAGEPEKLVPTLITEELKLSSNEKATFYKLLQKMRGDRTEITHIAEMLGEGFIITIKHEKGKKDATKTYAKMRTQVDGWMIAPPFEVSAATGVKSEVPVPAVSEPEKAFLWDLADLDMWNSIFIDGTYNKTINGEEVALSKNFVQFKILGASNFEGSPIQKLLDPTAVAVLKEQAAISNAAYGADAPKKTAEEVGPKAPPTVLGAAEESPEPPAEESAPETKEDAADKPDPLAHLGLTTKQ